MRASRGVGGRGPGFQTRGLAWTPTSLLHSWRRVALRPRAPALPAPPITGPGSSGGVGPARPWKCTFSGIFPALPERPGACISQSHRLQAPSLPLLSRCRGSRLLASSLRPTASKAPCSGPGDRRAQGAGRLWGHACAWHLAQGPAWGRCTDAPSALASGALHLLPDVLVPLLCLANTYLVDVTSSGKPARISLSRRVRCLFWPHSRPENHFLRVCFPHALSAFLIRLGARGGAHRSDLSTRPADGYTPRLPPPPLWLRVRGCD